MHWSTHFPSRGKSPNFGYFSQIHPRIFVRIWLEINFYKIFYLSCFYYIPSCNNFNRHLIQFFFCIFWYACQDIGVCASGLAFTAALNVLNTIGLSLWSLIIYETIRLSYRSRIALKWTLWTSVLLRFIWLQMIFFLFSSKDAPYIAFSVFISLFAI